MAEEITIKLFREEALVLLDLLAGFYDEESLQINDEVERVALFLLEGALDKQLTGVFQENYFEQVETAKQKLREKYIGKEEIESNSHSDSNRE